MAENQTHQSSFAPPELQIDLDAAGMSLSPGEIEMIEAEIGRLKPLVEKFPVQILHVTLEHNTRSQQYEVRLALVLSGQTFATGDVGAAWLPLLEQCVRKLIRRVEHYKQSMSGVPERQHRAAGTDAVLAPNQQIDGETVSRAIEQDDYTEFRHAMEPFEESLRDRIGRWVQRYPQVDAMIGERITIADIVEEVFLMAFEQFEHWHAELLFGQWLEGLIDPAVKAIARDPDGELEAINFQRTWKAPETGT